ncbi:hypothetical protein DPX16_12184 [Anabarilius grahami]|uniref:Uncharacterized protein n=1 Tax=Anabarilius grahami TaxID=495550 RepID=A0A3N0YS92_ANAGA|nr:hypothetical protein DPX16_12184 [Anabarilius grahami]
MTVIGTDPQQRPRAPDMSSTQIPMASFDSSSPYAWVFLEVTVHFEHMDECQEVIGPPPTGCMQRHDCTFPSKDEERTLQTLQ